MKRWLAGPRRARIGGIGGRPATHHNTLGPFLLLARRANARKVGSAVVVGALLAFGYPWRSRIGRIAKPERILPSSSITVVLLMLLLAGCGEHRAPQATGTPTLRPPTATAATVSASADARTQVQDALAVYTGLLNAYVAASNSGSTDTTELAKYATGRALQTLTDGLTGNKAKGVTSKGTPGIDPPQVTSVSPATDPTSVTVSGCLDDTHWLLYESNGQLYNTTAGGRRPVTAQIDKTHGVWKVTSLAIQQAPPSPQAVNTC